MTASPPPALEFLLTPIQHSPSPPPVLYSDSPRRSSNKRDSTSLDGALYSASNTTLPSPFTSPSPSPSPQGSPRQQTISFAEGANASSPSSSKRFKRGNASPRSRSRGSSGSRERIVPPGSPLIADVHLSKSRMIVTRKVCLYNDPQLDYPSVMLGFNVTIHTPPSSSSRVKDAQITLSFLSGEDGTPPPVIKGIAPSSGTGMGMGDKTLVESQKGVDMNLSLGYDPFARLSLTTHTSRKFSHTTQPTLLTSGVETTEAWITLDEDPTTREGVPSSFDFAVLVERSGFEKWGGGVKGFEVELSVEASLGRAGGAAQEKWQRFMGSPRAWRLMYDGVTEIGGAAGGSRSRLGSPVLGLGLAESEERGRGMVVEE
ncbi:hypothetical protein BCR35DRAFT_334293 [Leucosporidium creatinivorum]|uniref:Uncharacterized protein n=1 Tax=Leucosporidium creatinivorum TaxID=106004 RepID=A0A1Y2ECX5_9BASI|nr:hypothetical protein BCR35DRAFT_334293 [Leucosporidium creatinivorum]